MMERLPYRQIWQAAHGPIPRDETGRSFEIHHINGDRSDNRLENLQCVSIHEHYQIHFDQGDWLAAAAIARRMFADPDVMQQLNHKAGKESHRKKAGFHRFSAEEKRIHSAKGGRAHKGRKWWTDGVAETKSVESPGNGWKLGRACTTSGPKKGSTIGKFWNNGVVNKRAIESPGEEWVPGKLLNEAQRARRSEIAKKTLEARWKRHQN